MPYTERTVTISLTEYEELKAANKRLRELRLSKVIDAFSAFYRIVLQNNRSFKLNETETTWLNQEFKSLGITVTLVDSNRSGGISRVIIDNQ